MCIVSIQLSFSILQQEPNKVREEHAKGDTTLFWGRELLPSLPTNLLHNWANTVLTRRGPRIRAELWLQNWAIRSAAYKQIRFAQIHTSALQITLGTASTSQM